MAALCPRQQLFNNIELTKTVEWEFSKSRASGHFLVTGAVCVNVLLAKYPLGVILTNGEVIQSTHIYNLNILWLPSVMTEAHRMPGLSQLSLEYL